MNKKVLSIIIAIVIILTIVGVIIYVSNKGKNSDVADDNQSNENIIDDVVVEVDESQFVLVIEADYYVMDGVIITGTVKQGELKVGDAIKII